LKKVQGDRVHVEGITLKAPRKRVGIDKLHVKMAEEVVFPRNKRFDCIFAVNILQHASSPMYVMQKMFNNLKPGGLGFIAITGMNPEVMVALSMWAQSKAIKVIAAGERDDFHSIIFQRTTNADFELLQLRL
jgi:2-polyprenyl-3-methyl-5-hydroxy-6-metoxy-1,4-benzoquinol methylase